MNYRVKIICGLLAAGLGNTLTAQTLQGAGASFPYPLYSKWMSDYQKQKGVQINYQSIGSGGGIKQILQGTVDFGATDAPMTEAERAKAKSVIHHIPSTMGAVVVAFHVPGLSSLKLTPDVLADIYLGKIKQWNDGKIQAVNGGVKLPSTPITVAYRSDGSGTSAVFTEYLCKVSPEWKSQVGEGKSVKFPVGMGAKGNEGVTGMVKSMPGSIGYLELAYAKQNQLSMASIRNRSGKFILPSPEGVSAAAASAVIPEDLCASITDGKGANDYPIASFSYILAYEKHPDPVKGKVLADFLLWAIHEGQNSASSLDYAPLPKGLIKRIEAKVKKIH